MTRILQIRRGTAAQNDNFTGLAGEISMDTDTKTLRIHDGETLGGFLLARADMENTNGAPSGEGTNFDIETVPVGFWNGLFAAHNLRPARFLESTLCTVANTSFYDYAFDEVTLDTDISSAIAECVLVCQTPEAGWAVGDIVRGFGIGNRANPSPNLFLDSNGLHIRLGIGTENFWVSHKTTGVTTNITNANWKIKFRVWY
ncbi:MAG: hypothetical protein FWE50_00345 [Alphaproteobacteria bacterium]|nr:hypothetical protein [Alphaproteobacteria bacterium]